MNLPIELTDNTHAPQIHAYVFETTSNTQLIQNMHAHIKQNKNKILAMQHTKSISANPNSPKETLESLLTQHINKMYTNPKDQLDTLNALFQNPALNPETTLQVIEEIKQEKVRTHFKDTLLQNPSLNSQYLHTETLKLLPEASRQQYNLNSIAANPQTTPETLALLMGLNNVEIDKRIALNPNADGGILEILLETYLEKLETKTHLTKTFQETIRNITQNPKTSKETLEKIRVIHLTQRTLLHPSTATTLVVNPSIGTDTIDMFIENHPTLNPHLAKNPALTTLQQTILAKTTDPYTRATMLQNPNLNPDIALQVIKTYSVKEHNLIPIPHWERQNAINSTPIVKTFMHLVAELNPNWMHAKETLDLKTIEQLLETPDLKNYTSKVLETYLQETLDQKEANASEKNAFALKQKEQRDINLDIRFNTSMVKSLKKPAKQTLGF